MCGFQWYCPFCNVLTCFCPGPSLGNILYTFPWNRTCMQLFQGVLTYKTNQWFIIYHQTYYCHTNLNSNKNGVLLTPIHVYFDGFYLQFELLQAQNCESKKITFTITKLYAIFFQILVHNAVQVQYFRFGRHNHDVILYAPCRQGIICMIMNS